MIGHKKRSVKRNKLKNIIYLSKNMEKYEGASYQNDVIVSLRKNSNIFLYGPGYEKYSTNDDIHEIIKKSSFNPDVIVLGHSWLSDNESVAFNNYESIKFQNCKIPKLAILNKEYVNLEKKLNFFKINKFDLCFSHHHEIENYQNITGINFIFWPFAFNQEIYKYDQEKKKIDLGFTGILQNKNKTAYQSDIRAKLMMEIFFCFFDNPLLKKKKFKNINVYWNSIPRSFFGKAIKKTILNKRRLNNSAYPNLLKKTKIFLNTLSPLGLISPRYFENMGCRSLVFCEESSLYKNIFDEGTYVTFKNDISDFYEKIFYYLENSKERDSITSKAFQHVNNKHTWDERINTLLKKI